jgi:hypothetical protein
MDTKSVSLALMLAGIAAGAGSSFDSMRLEFPPRVMAGAAGVKVAQAAPLNEDEQGGVRATIPNVRTNSTMRNSEPRPTTPGFARERSAIEDRSTAPNRANERLRTLPDLLRGR